VPVAHAVQAAWPVAALYVPTGQDKHADDEFAPVDGLYKPIEHEIQVMSPVWLLYVPVGQSLQAETDTEPVNWL